MKKFFLSILAVCALFLSSCGGVAGVAVDSVLYMEMLKEGNYEKFVDNVSPALSAEERAFYLESLIATEEGVGKVKDYDVQSSAITEAGNEAQVIFTVTYESGDVIDFPMDLVLEGSDWKMTR